MKTGKFCDIADDFVHGGGNSVYIEVEDDVIMKYSFL